MEVLNSDSILPTFREASGGLDSFTDEDLISLYREREGLGDLGDSEVAEIIETRASQVGKVPENPSIIGKLYSAENSIKQSVGRTVAAIPKGISVLARRITQNMSPDARRFWLGGEGNIDDSALFQLGEFIEEEIEKAYPTDPRLQESFVFNTLPQAIGSMATFIAASPLGGGATATLGVTGQVSGSFDEAIAEGATEDQAIEAASSLINIAGGASEALPVGRVIQRASRPLGKGRLIQGLLGALEEGSQEAVQTAASNLAAMRVYDPDRRIDQGIAEPAGAGGVIGFITSFTAAAMGLKLRGANVVRREDGSMVAVVDESEADIDRVVEVAASMDEGTDFHIIKHDGSVVEGRGPEDLINNFSQPDPVNPAIETRPQGLELIRRESTSLAPVVPELQAEGVPGSSDEPAMFSRIDFGETPKSFVDRVFDFISTSKENAIDRIKTEFSDSLHPVVSKFNHMLTREAGAGAALHFQSERLIPRYATPDGNLKLLGPGTRPDANSLPEFKAKKQFLKPQQVFETLLRTLGGHNDTIDRAYETGIIDHAGSRDSGNVQYFKDEKTGDQLNMQYYFSALDQSTEESLFNEHRLAMAAAVTKRSGSLLLRKDMDVGFSKQEIAEALDYLERIKDNNPEQWARINEAARRYQEIARAGLKYMVGKGRLSRRQYNRIVENQDEYVALRRVIETEDGSSYTFKKGLGQGQDPIKTLKGSSKNVRDPFEGLMDFLNRSVYESDRNEVLTMFMDVVDATDGKDIAIKVRKSGKDTVKIFRNGKAEHYRIKDPALAKALLQITGSQDNLGIIRLLSLPAKAIRATVTNAPPFAVRNLARDTVNRFVVSRNDPSIKDFTEMDRKFVRERNLAFGGGQFGYYVGDRASYRSLMTETMHKLAKDKHTVVLHPFEFAKRFTHNYQKWLKNSELLTREAEWVAAYRKGRKEGLNDYQASIYAAGQSRDLLDFHIAGNLMRQINQVIPFSNAAVQGLKRTVRSARESPAGFLLKTAVYVGLPSIFMRMLAQSGGYEDEYENLPAYQRDLFYNFKVSGDTWVSIPKPFEIGALGSGFERAYSKYARGEERALSDYPGSLFRAVFPVDESALALGFRAPLEIITNKDLFRNKSIVPQFEVDVDPRLRNPRNASRLGKALHGFGGIVDARQVDHFLTSSFSYFGGYALKFSNIGSDNNPRFGVSDTGLLRKTPVYGARDVQWVLTNGKRFKLNRSEEYRVLQDLIGFYFDSEGEQQTLRGQEIIRYASQLRDYWEEKDVIKEALKEADDEGDEE